MASFTSPQLRVQQAPSIYILDSRPQRPCKSAAARTARQLPLSSTTRPSTAWQILALIAPMTGLGMLGWKLHQAHNECDRLQHNVENVSFLARASVADQAYTKDRLADTNADNWVLHHFLDDAEAGETALKQDVGQWRMKHDEVVLASEHQAQAWSVQDASLRMSLQSESAQRTEAQQTADHYESESQRLAGEAGNLQQCVIQLKADNNGMAGEINRQRSCINTLQSENSSLRSCNSQLGAEIHSLRCSVGSLESANSQLRCENSRLQSTICSLEGRIRCLEQELSQARAHR